MLRRGGGIDVAFEPEEPAEGRLPHDLLGDPRPVTANPRAGNSEFGFRIPARSAFEYLTRGDGAAANRRVRQRIEWIEEQSARARCRPGRPEGRTAKRVPMVEQHVSIPRSWSQSPTGIPLPRHLL